MARRKPRKVRPKEKGVPKGYDSKWEYDLHKGILQNWNHHGKLGLRFNFLYIHLNE